ncbi:MAG: type IV pili twitching motility protein PilT, partial [Pseudomonadota bacterium]|nr:type IV pili twitching motility protein PilT [Pseudomonadota bacterium]
MDFENWLKPLADEGGSDLYLTTGAPPSAKFDGELKPLSDERLSPGFTRDLAYELMDGQQAREFDEKLEMNLAISLPGVGRFRVNIFKQRNEVGMVVRYIVVDIPPMQQLGLPSIAADLIKRKRGLLLVV